MPLKFACRKGGDPDYVRERGAEYGIGVLRGMRMERSGENEQSRRDSCETVARQGEHPVIVSNLMATLSGWRVSSRALGP
jgi:hypothetical protein